MSIHTGRVNRPLQVKSDILFSMKIDRLLSIIVYLLNRDLVPAKALADRFGVTVRTIQRDMEAIELAGIPIFTIQGPRGGYGIMDSWKMDRQLMSLDDLYVIITALEGVGSSLADSGIDSTLEKVKTLLPGPGLELFSERNEKLSIDFSMMGGDPRQRETFRIVRKAVENEQLLRFSYTSNKLEQSCRTVEPMTIAFRWRSWYLFGYCREREDYRLFRISRIREPELIDSRFSRRDLSFNAFLRSNYEESTKASLEIVLKFSSLMRPMVEEYYPEEECSTLEDGSLVVRTHFPEDGWVYGYILSFGDFVEVLEPERIRKIIGDSAAKIADFYQ